MPDRPRPGAAAVTGQFPVARVRATGAGPHGTAQIPVVRAPQPAPDPLPARAVAAPTPVDPARRRLRVPPPAPDAPAVATPPTTPIPTPVDRTGWAPPRSPAAPPVPQRPAPGRPQPAIRPAGTAPHGPGRQRVATPPAPRTPPVRPRTAPPAPPAPPAAAPETARRRRPLRSAVALLAAVGLLAIYALPSVGGATAGEPPVAGVHLDDDLQQFAVSQGVTAPGVQTDEMSGTMPVVAPDWVVPLRGDLRDGFGLRLAQPVAGVSLFHRGQDIGGGCGAPIHAAAAGVVQTARWWGTYGNWVLIDHGNGVETGYAHQERMVVSPGQHVAVGQVIGYEGSTGASTGCHLHLEVHLNGIAVNPVPFFTAKGIPLGP